MILFHHFHFKGDLFFEKKTDVPLSTAGLTFLRGVNHDGIVAGSAGNEGNAELSNGAGKTRLFQLLEIFIYGENDRSRNLKKFVLPTFEGTLDFENTRTGERWNWKYSVEEGWTVHLNGELFYISHQATTVQARLQKEIGLTRDEWCHYIYICHDSLRVLIAGKPKERREYLESFFSIDAFYQEKYDEAYSELINLQLNLDQINVERGKLRDIEDLLQDSKGAEWLQYHLWASDSAIRLLRQKTQEDSQALAENSSQRKDWQDFQKIQLAVNPDEVSQLKAGRDLLFTELDALQKRLKAQKDLQDWTSSVLRSHGQQRPESIEAPENPKPATESLLEMSAVLTQMRDKMGVRSELLAVTKKVQELQLENPVDRAGVARQLEAVVEEIAALKHRVDLVGKLSEYSDGICPTCYQSVTDAVHQAARGDTHESLVRKLSAARTLQVELRRTESRLDAFDGAVKEEEFIRERYSRFPTFGEKLSDVEDRYAQLKKSSSEWLSYEKNQSINAEWETKSRVLKERFDALGGKAFLAEDIESTILTKKSQLQSLDADLGRLQEYFSLYDRIKTYPSLKTLQRESEILQEALSFYDVELQTQYELSAAWRVDLKQFEDHHREAEELRSQVEGFEAVQEQYNVGKARCDFYSPKGFKLFELKTKCKEFVERCNHWSKIFFQEPYEWSVSDDVENLNFYVKPVKSNTEPYPIGHLSNGEKNRASRVLLFSQLEMIPQVKRTNLLVLDEVESFLDQAGARAYIYHVLEILKTTFPKYSIVVVSHLSALINSGHIDHLWVVEKKRRKSKLTTYPFFTKKKYVTSETSLAQGGEQ